ncbi:hypothetical protein DICPUDRAFT_80883, partial [Dictyostelium purpureum]
NKNVSFSKLRKKFDKISFEDYVKDDTNKQSQSHQHTRDKLVKKQPLQSQKKKCFYVKTEKKIKPTRLKRDIELYNSIKESYFKKENSTQLENEESKVETATTPPTKLLDDNSTIDNNNNSDNSNGDNNGDNNSNSNSNSNTNNDTENNNNSSDIITTNTTNVNIKEYINQILPNKEIDNTCKELIRILKGFQEKSFQNNNPNKVKKRFVSGLREVLKLLEVDKISCVIISSNIEENGALNKLVEDIIRLCRSKKVLYTFALSSRSLGKSIGKTIKISVLGILDYDGANEIYQKLFNQTKQSRDEFFKLQNIIKNNNSNDNNIDNNAIIGSPTINTSAANTSELNETDKIKILLDRNENIEKYKEIEALYKNEKKKIKQQHKEKLKEFEVIRKQKNDEREQEAKRIQLQRQKENQEQQKLKQKIEKDKEKEKFNNTVNKKQTNKLIPSGDVSDQLLYDNRDEIKNNKNSNSNNNNNNNNNKKQNSNNQKNKPKKQI